MINISELHVPRMQIEWETETVLPMMGESTADRWKLKIIRSILSKGRLLPTGQLVTYIIELRPQTSFFDLFNPEELIEEIEAVAARWAIESMESILEFA